MVIVSAHRQLLRLLALALLAACGGTGAQGPPGPRGAAGPAASAGAAGPIGPAGLGIALVIPAVPFIHPVPPRLLPSPPPVHLLPPGPPPPAAERIVDASIGLNALVAGVYVDCTGHTVLPSDGAFVDACSSAVRYLVGHDVPTIFQPLHRVGLGDIVTDGAARLRVLDLRDRWPAGGFPPIPPGTTVQYQTCDDNDATHNLIVSLGPETAPTLVPPAVVNTGATEVND